MEVRVRSKTFNYYIFIYKSDIKNKKKSYWRNYKGTIK